MKRSTDRILVMHQGTLPREQALRDMVVAKEEGKDYNANDLDSGIKSAGPRGGAIRPSVLGAGPERTSTRAKHATT